MDNYIPVFKISCKTGSNVDLVKRFINEQGSILNNHDDQ